MTRIGTTLPLEAGAPQNVVVQRRFPTFDFAVRTSLSPGEASRTLEAALEAPAPVFWFWPLLRLSGRVNGGVFKCRPKGGLVPSVSVAIIPREDGGADILVRVFDWPFFLLLGFALVACAAMVALNQRELLEAIGILSPPFLFFGAGGYVANGVFARRTFLRIFQANLL